LADRHPDHDLLAELEPVAEQLLDRHLSMAKEWLPHEYIPWSLGRDFDTEPWTPDQPRLTGGPGLYPQGPADGPGRHL
jgi:acyl-[acyl-carrier-protein] desaturase